MGTRDDKTHIESVSKMGDVLKTEAYIHKSIEGTVKIQKRDLVQGRGIPFTRVYDFCGNICEEAGNYDNVFEANDSFKDAKSNLETIMGNYFKVECIGKEGNSYKFKISSLKRLDKALERFTKKTLPRSVLIQQAFANKSR
jgi:hypothetical protein